MNKKKKINFEEKEKKWGSLISVQVWTYHKQQKETIVIAERGERERERWEGGLWVLASGGIFVYDENGVVILRGETLCCLKWEGKERPSIKRVLLWNLQSVCVRVFYAKRIERERVRL